uniref:Propionyl-CoA carboxylase alpha chain n=2 Tax=Hirondellea gigas TaxID=1518452 RepID=A0A6A7G8M9_9CRUS
MSAPSSRLFKKILIANRGEIACRVIRTCRKMGIPTVSIHSEVDVNSLHVRMADEAVCVGPARSMDSYLNIDTILQAIEITRSDAVHPGYGFLSENAAFADALASRGIVFIGPEKHAMEVMGDKIRSKEAAELAKINQIPSETRVLQSEEDCVETCKRVGYPVMVKASAGGGGKGMRIARNDDESRIAYRLSKAEAMSSFGDDRLFVERFIEDPRHIEIQILADSFGNIIYLNERECSIQRRYQKIIEECPSPVVTPELRAAMGEQACQIARAVDYRSAGTIEFLVDKQLNFYFLEMNTRLQVEHPVTELTTGVDLVEEMVRIAAGQELSLKQEDVQLNGWAFECRIYAENPLQNFLPSIGYLEKYEEPTSSQVSGTVRVDSGIVEGSEVSVHYDPMISKLITHGENREEALRRMRDALDSYVIRGVSHNISFLRAVCDHPKFIDGDFSTKFIEQEYPEGFHGPTLTSSQRFGLISTALMIHCRNKLRAESISPIEPEMYSELICTLDDIQFTVKISNYRNNEAKLIISSPSETIESFVKSGYNPNDAVLTTSHDKVDRIYQLIKAMTNKYQLQFEGSVHEIQVRTPREQELFALLPKDATTDEEGNLLSPMPGTVFSVSVVPKQEISEHDEVCVIEAMKMQNIIAAPKSGVIRVVKIKPGDTISPGDTIYELE